MTESALIYAFILSGPRRGEALTWEEVKGNQLPDESVWLHFDYTHPHTREWLLETHLVDNLVAESLVSDETRPRAATLENGMIVSLRGVNLNPESDPEDMVSIRMWTAGNLIVSARKRRLLSTGDIAELIAKGIGPETPGQFIAMLAEKLISRMQGVIYDIEEQISNLEEQAQDGDARALRQKTADLRRQTVALRRYFHPQREALRELIDNEIKLFSEDDLSHLRETTNHLTRYLEELDAIKDRAAITQEELAGAVNEELNNRMYVLNIVAALFLPLGFLTGLLGINIGGIPGSENGNAFWVFCLMLAGLISAQVVIFKMKRWF